MRKEILCLVGVAVLLVPNAAWGQESPLGSFWLTPYVGIGFQGEYHDAFVQFTDGDLELLRLEPMSAILYGVTAGIRAGTAWTVQANLSTSKPEATYVEDNNVRPTVDVWTTQVELGLLYDLSTFDFGEEIAPFMVGGGLSLMLHSFDPFQWDGTLIEPSSTSIGAHGLVALDLPLSPNVSLRSQAKLTATSLSLGDLNDKIGFAEGTAVAVPLDGGISPYMVISVGLTLRL